MSFDTLPVVAPTPKLSIVGAFKAAPTLVKILVAESYLTALWALGQGIYIAVWGKGNAPTAVQAIFWGLLWGLIWFLVGKGVARGSHGMWLLNLVLSVLVVPVGVFVVLATVTVATIVTVVYVVASVALVLTPVVRQHCTKKSFNAQPDVAQPPKLSIVGAFRAAPTLVKALVAALYLNWLLLLGRYVVSLLAVRDEVEAIAGSSQAPALAKLGDQITAGTVVAVTVLGLVVGTITFLLGKGLARGARSTWLLTLVLAGILLVWGVISVLAGVGVGAMLSVAILLAIVALLLTPVVRQHCVQK